MEDEMYPIIQYRNQIDRLFQMHNINHERMHGVQFELMKRLVDSLAEIQLMLVKW